MSLATITKPPFFFFPNTSLHPSKPFPNSKVLNLLKIPKLPFHKLNSIKNENQEEAVTTTSIQEQDQLEQKLIQELQEQDIDPRRLEEKFAVINTGIHECRSCGYQYDNSKGDPSYPIAPGLEFEQLPEDWRCPTCGAAKGFFFSKSVEIAGFAQNQQFGLGANTLTSGQKALLIYGSLLMFFALFLSGYFLQ